MRSSIAGSLLYGYLSVAIPMFVISTIVGFICKKDILGNGVKFSFLNSLLLSALWPVTAIVSFCGMCYEVVKTWKKL